MQEDMKKIASYGQYLARFILEMTQDRATVTMEYE